MNTKQVCTNQSDFFPKITKNYQQILLQVECMPLQTERNLF